MTATVQGWLILWGAVVVLLIAAAMIVELHGATALSWTRPARGARKWFARRAQSPEGRLPARLAALQRALPAHRHVAVRRRGFSTSAGPHAVRNLRLVKR